MFIQLDITLLLLLTALVIPPPQYGDTPNWQNIYPYNPQMTDLKALGESPHSYTSDTGWLGVDGCCYRLL